MQQTAGNVVALSSGQQNWEMQFGAEKYAKFAYSSRYAFSVEADERSFGLAAFDGMLGLSDDKRHYRVREENETAQIAGTTLFSRWRPWPDVTVETWLVPAGLTKQADSKTNTAATIWLSDGTAGQSYTVTNRITSAAGRTEDRSFTIRVEER